MITPVLAGNSPNGAMSNGRSMPFNYGGALNSWTHYSSTTVPTVIAVAGTVSALNFSIPVAPGGVTSWTLTLTKNGSATALTTTITGAAFSNSDTTHSVTVAPGDLLFWSLTASGTPAACTTAQYGAIFTSTASNETFVNSMEVSTGTSATVTQFISLGSGEINATRANCDISFPASGTIDQMYVHTATAPGGTASYAYTLFQNSSATALTATVTGVAVAANDTNVGHAISVTAGDQICIQSVPTGTPAVGLTSFSFRFVPTTPGQSVAFVTFAAQNLNSITTYGASYGLSLQSNATENVVFSIAPVAFTMQNLYYNSTVAAGTGASRALTLRQNSTNAALTTSLSGVSQVSNTDLVHTVSVALNDTLDFTSIPSGSPNNMPQERFSYVMYIAPPSSGNNSLLMFT